MGLFSRKCPNCRGELYIQRTSPVMVLGCRACQKKAKLLRDKGLTDKEIRSILTPSAK